MLKEQFEEAKNKAILDFGKTNFSRGFDEAFDAVVQTNENISKESIKISEASKIATDELKKASNACKEIKNSCSIIKSLCENPFGYKGDNV